MFSRQGGSFSAIRQKGGVAALPFFMAVSNAVA